MHLVNHLVGIALREVELAALEGLLVLRRGEARARLPGRDAAELREELDAPAPNFARQLRLVIREVEERGGGGELLPLKKHRRGRREQHERRQRAEASRTRERVHALAPRGVGDLVVVL